MAGEILFADGGQGNRALRPPFLIRTLPTILLIVLNFCFATTSCGFFQPFLVARNRIVCYHRGVKEGL